MTSRANALRDFDRAWEFNWGATLPPGHLLRTAHPDRWVHFHSLPPRGLGRLFRPYDGGVDILTSTLAERNGSSSTQGPVTPLSADNK